MSTIVVGDVHGCAEEFAQVVERAGFVPGRDVVVSVGDIIDKGPDPIGAVRFARSIGCQMVMGNHEEKFVRWRRNERARVATGRENQMKVSPAKAAQWAAFSDEDEAWIASAPWIRDVAGFKVVHAGMMPGVAVEAQKPSVATRIRRVAGGKFSEESDATPWSEVWDQPHSVIVGHEVHSMTDVRVDVTATGHRVWSIDTGCVYGGRMTAMVIEDSGDVRVVQVQASRAWAQARD